LNSSKQQVDSGGGVLDEHTRGVEAVVGPPFLESMPNIMAISKDPAGLVGRNKKSRSRYCEGKIAEFFGIRTRKKT
jgi:hypothetical protein